MHAVWHLTHVRLYLTSAQHRGQQERQQLERLLLWTLWKVNQNMAEPFHAMSKAVEHVSIAA